MTDPQILPRLLAAELDRLEGDMARHLRGVTPCIDFSAEGYMKSYGQLLELQAMVSSRRVEVTTAPEPQEPPVQQLHLRGTLAVIDALIRYHEVRTQDSPYSYTFTTVDHRRATETLNLLRDHLDRCYDVRS